jgi:uncharacterized membrane protein YraQ (UPF0718 family)
MSVEAAYLDTIIAIFVIAYVIIAVVLDFARKRSERINQVLQPYSLERLVPDRYKIWFMIAIAIISLISLIYCQICQLNDPDVMKRATTYFQLVSRDFKGIIPWFIIGCIFAGLVTKYSRSGRIHLPKSMLGSAFFASIIPICSCAAIPMAHGMMLGRSMRVRAVITFLIVVPVLSPIVMILAVSQIGLWYLATEIVAVFAFAMLTGIFIERYAGVRDETDERPGSYSCKGCRSSHMHTRQGSALLAGWDQFFYLLKFILFGILIGAFIAAFVDPKTLADFFGTQADLLGSIPGLILMVLIGIPIFICSGEDVVILAPLLQLGLPLGHAIAFAISGNAICVTAVPVLNATFGKRVTLLIFGAFFIGSILVGLVINSLIWGMLQVGL